MNEDFNDWWCNHGWTLQERDPKELALETFKAGIDAEKENYEKRANAERETGDLTLRY